MSKIRAVVVDPTVTGRLVLREFDAPNPAPHEALVRVASISLNRGEVRRSTTADAGWRPGWDLAGVVETAAADGSGPNQGARVVGLLRFGAWGELVAVPTETLAELPDSVSFAQAATLPVAGLTAYHALLQGGSLLEKPVLITAATGGVGNFAIQLAKLSGARVVAHIRKPEDEALVKAAGADAVVLGEDLSNDKFGPYHLIAESVGGKVLGDALGLIAPDGVLVSFGTSGGGEVTFNASRFYGIGGAKLYGLILFRELKAVESAAIGLNRLGNLVATGQIRTPISIEASWTKVAEVAQQLLDRQYSGKAVLHIAD
ncbi:MULTISPECIES: zinc-binding dehydrogenase [Pseudanabaena]|jgi:NADPH:quinone reductase|uniref:zinc-binding dehydrogenase n=1 Tax=Pseudanabaena TaxID=1152 RepID=UPI002479267E|nr:MULTISPECIES: zinc-binding dehydrogenase [Pseudanabaena]MEA5488162.1 zinc-binding dehydrogenase [Pseudanabaena sp. CCNP1317]WGS75397.1 zinc-binding dehydrogenase [Pseudanabaena galeata CCNP1313]